MPALVAAMNVKEDGAAAVTAVLDISNVLSRIGPAAVPALVEAMKDANPNRRLGARRRWHWARAPGEVRHVGADRGPAG